MTIGFTRQMTVGLLLAEEGPEAFIARAGSLRERFRAMLAPELEMKTWRIDQGHFPDSATQCDAWVISGSPASAYDDLEWIARLRAFLGEAIGQRPLVGICFGHQIIADCLGGEVTKSRRGRIWGFQYYKPHDLEPWMRMQKRLRVAVAHGDQVISLPQGARIIASCSWTPLAGLYYADQRILTVQCHPESTLEYRRALIEYRRGNPLSDIEADMRLSRCKSPIHHSTIHQWINGLFSR